MTMQPDPTDRGRTLSSGVGVIPPPSNGRDTSPLLPPSVPFAQRSVSPRPTVDTSTPYSEAPPRSPVAPASPRFSSSTPQTQSPVINFPPGRSSSPFRPPEYSRGSPMNKSSSSINVLPPVPHGARTISAAAFRRGPQRMTSGTSDPGNAGNGPGIADTTPLTLKKKLPSSPYPAQRERSASNSTSNLNPASTPAQRPESTVGDDDHFDYISAYSRGPEEEEGTPMKGDFGTLGHVEVVGGVPLSPGGYGEGRFATNLEGSHDNLR